MAKIHPTSVVCDGAVLGDGVEIGPLCYVGPNVKIGDGTRLLSHCNVDGYTTLGCRNVLHPFAALGQPAQDHAVIPGSVMKLEVGDDNIFREGTAIHTGTQPDSSTIIGNHNMFMNGSHVGHNCIIGNNVIYVSQAVSGGYAEIQDNVILSGLVAIHQFCRVGRFTIISGCSAFSKDVPPFMIVAGDPAVVSGLNSVGLARAGMPAEHRSELKKAFRILYRSGLSLQDAIATMEQELESNEPVEHLLRFLRTVDRGIIRTRRG